MVTVPHDQPIRLMRGIPRRWRMKSMAEPTSFTATLVVTMGGIASGWLIHFRWARGSTVASYVYQIHVPAMLGDVIHPRQPFERKIKSRLRRLCRTMNEQQCLLRCKLQQVFRPLVSDIQLDCGVAGVDHELLGNELHSRLGHASG